MAKTFAPRVSKKKRQYIDLDQSIEDKIKSRESRPYLEGADLVNIRLAEIHVKEQVRTKFNDDSLQELAQNILENGLIQPLVVSEIRGRYTLICGERRFRAMSLVDIQSASCFILRDKTEDELMAIQFSENSSREDLHYIDQSNSIAEYRKLTGASERKIVAALGVSKTEVHRSLMIAKLPKRVREAAKKYNTEKYVLLEWGALEKSDIKEDIKKKIIDGTILKRAQLKKVLRENNAQVIKKTGRIKSSGNELRTQNRVTTSLFLKTLQQKSKDLDPETQKMLKKLLEETRDTMDM